jgi:hypothetical protein
MEREFVAKTASAEEYLNARTLRPIKSALIDTADNTKATITWEAITDHLSWTKIRYTHSGGEVEEVRVDNDLSTTLCTDIKRGTKIQIQCAFNPPGTKDDLVTEWSDYESPFLLKYGRTDWVAVTKGGNHNWNDSGGGAQDLWAGGHPMLILDEDISSGWHSQLSTPLPQVVIIDMKESKTVSKITLYPRNGVGTSDNGYWNNISLYLTDNLSMTDYVSHTVDWNSGTRIADYNTWVTKMRGLIPANPPAASWGAPIAQLLSKNYLVIPVLLPQTRQGQFLIVMFPDNSIGWASYINIGSVEVYTE